MINTGNILAMTGRQAGRHAGKQPPTKFNKKTKTPSHTNNNTKDARYLVSTNTQVHHNTRTKIALLLASARINSKIISIPRVQMVMCTRCSGVTVRMPQ